MKKTRKYTPDEWMKHLELIQQTINRMANNSFLIKSWTVTLVAALFVLAAKDSDYRFAIIALFPIFVFWGLDAYYLRQERLFRKLYDHIRSNGDPKQDGGIEPFIMDTTPFSKGVGSQLKTWFACVVFPLYLCGAIFVLILIWVFANAKP